MRWSSWVLEHNDAVFFGSSVLHHKVNDGGKADDHLIGACFLPCEFGEFDAKGCYLIFAACDAGLLCGDLCGLILDRLAVDKSLFRLLDSDADVSFGALERACGLYAGGVLGVCRDGER